MATEETAFKGSLPQKDIYYRDIELLIAYCNASIYLEEFSKMIEKKLHKLKELEVIDHNSMSFDDRKKHLRLQGFIKSELTVYHQVIRLIQSLEDKLDDKQTYESKMEVEIKCNRARDEVYAKYFLPMLKQKQFFEMAYYASNLKYTNKDGVDMAMIEDMLFLQKKWAK